MRKSITRKVTRHQYYGVLYIESAPGYYSMDVKTAMLFGAIPPGDYRVRYSLHPKGKIMFRKYDDLRPCFIPFAWADRRIKREVLPWR